MAKDDTKAAAATQAANEKKSERLTAIVAAARVLVRGWESSGFYDRQDAAGALALHEALSAHEHKK